MAVSSPLPREDPWFAPKWQLTAQEGWKVSSTSKSTGVSLYASNNIGL